MDQEELFRRLAVSLAIGLLIGLERGWQTRAESDRQRTAGLRTFALSGLLGGICGLLADSLSPIILAASLLAFAGSLTVFSFLEAKAEKNFSVTGVIAGILTFMLGAYATVGEELVAVAAAVAMAILLALRDALHSWIRTITWLEMRSVLVLLAMTFLLLPILPDRPVDPWGVLNPAEIWLFSILIAAVSFAGYVAVRMLGDRAGIAVAAIAGGVASSTAATVSFARLARDHKRGERLLSGGILLAGVVMVARVLVLVGLLNLEALQAILLPSLAAAAVQLFGGVAFIGWKDKGPGHPELEMRNPFEITTVLQLAGLIGVIMLLVKLVVDKSSMGIFLLAAVSGVADVDALTLSVTRLAGTELGVDTAVVAILIAVSVNTLSKATMAAVIGGKNMGAAVGTVSAAAVGALILTFWLI